MFDHSILLFCRTSSHQTQWLLKKMSNSGRDTNLHRSKNLQQIPLEICTFGSPVCRIILNGEDGEVWVRMIPQASDQLSLNTNPKRIWRQKSQKRSQMKILIKKTKLMIWQKMFQFRSIFRQQGNVKNLPKSFNSLI